MSKPEGNLGFDERMYVVTCRILVKSTGPADAIVEVSGMLSDLVFQPGGVLDTEAGAVEGPYRLDYGVMLSDIEEGAK